MVLDPPCVLSGLGNVVNRRIQEYCMKYELEFLQLKGGMRVTVWYLNDAGERTGSYHRIIDDGLIYIQDMDSCLQLIDDPELPLRGGFFDRPE